MTRPAMSEADLQAAVIDTARLLGLLVHHDRPARTADGTWRTHIQGTPGFPDLVLAGPGGVAFVELKSATGRTSRAQDQWLTTLHATGAEAHLWRPADWPVRILHTLHRLAGRDAPR